MESNKEQKKIEINSEELSLPDGYQLISSLGEGASAVVYKALQLSTQRLVSVKIFKNLSLDDSAIEKTRFHREATLLAEIQHPNIQKILSYSIGKNNAPTLISEYVEGKTLEDLLAQNKRLSATQFVDIFANLSEALSYLHEIKLLHRDLKPANIIIRTEESNTNSAKCTLIDFGLAKLIAETDAASDKLTKTGVIIGTVNYMSPEQGEGKAVDERSEVFSLGCIMFEAINGYLPWSGENVMHTILLKKDAAHAAMQNDVPQSINELIEKTLQKNPLARPSMLDIAASLNTPEFLRQKNSSFSAKRIGIIMLLTLIFAGACVLSYTRFKKSSEENPAKSVPVFKETTSKIKLAEATRLAELHFRRNSPRSTTLRDLLISDKILTSVISQRNIPQKYKYSAYCQLANNAQYESLIDQQNYRPNKELDYLRLAMNSSIINGNPAWDAFVAPLRIGEYYENNGRKQEAQKDFRLAKSLKDKLNSLESATATNETPLKLNLPEGVPGQMYHDADSYLKYKIAYLDNELTGDSKELEKFAQEVVIPIGYRIKAIYLIISNKETQTGTKATKWRNLLKKQVDETIEGDSGDQLKLADAFMNAGQELCERHGHLNLAIEAILQAIKIYPPMSNQEQLLAVTKQLLDYAKSSGQSKLQIKELEEAFLNLEAEVKSMKGKRVLTDIITTDPSLSRH